jgi:hypothetical protein
MNKSKKRIALSKSSRTFESREMTPQACCYSIDNWVNDNPNLKRTKKRATKESDRLNAAA